MGGPRRADQEPGAAGGNGMKNAQAGRPAGAGRGPQVLPERPGNRLPAGHSIQRALPLSRSSAHAQNQITSDS